MFFFVFFGSAIKYKAHIKTLKNKNSKKRKNSKKKHASGGFLVCWKAPMPMRPGGGVRPIQWEHSCISRPQVFGPPGGAWNPGARASLPRRPADARPARAPPAAGARAAAGKLIVAVAAAAAVADRSKGLLQEPDPGVTVPQNWNSSSFPFYFHRNEWNWNLYALDADRGR